MPSGPSQRHLGKLGAGDTGETFIDELGPLRGLIIPSEGNCAEVRAAREGKSTAVGTASVRL